MRALYRLLLLITFPLVVQAESVGVAYLASEAYTSAECNRALEVFRGVKSPTLEILWGTFSKHNLCAARFLARHKGRPHTLIVHFSNEAGRRNNRLDVGEMCRNLSVHAYNRKLERENEAVLKRIRRRALKIGDFFEENANPNTRLILSTGLEDNYSRRAYRTILNELKKNISWKVLLMRNPVYETNYIFGAAFIELHGFRFTNSSEPPCIRSLDGTDIRFGGQHGALNGSISIPEVRTFLRRNRNCIRLLWWSGSQGIERGKFTKPRGRRFRLFPEDITLINHLLRQHDE